MNETDPTNQEYVLPAQARFCLNMSLVGLLCSTVSAFFLPTDPSYPDLASTPEWFRIIETWRVRLTSWPWALLPCAFLLFQIVRWRFKNQAWISALVLGYLLGIVVIRFLR
jgi:hypothetical protein